MALQQRLGGYEVLGRIARGSTADVFLAVPAGGDDDNAVRAREHIGRNRRVVLKRLYAHLAIDEGFLRMFVDEARLLSRFRHRHIVRVHDLDEDDETCFAVLELVDGPSVAAALRVQAHQPGHGGRGLRPEVAVAIAADVAEALVAVHGLTDADTHAPLELVHRDVTPHNILVGRDGAVKLADFGIARSMVGRRRGVLATKDTTAGARKGRASYLAPEIVSGRRQVIDHRVDLYGLGATLWCALCGTPPYVADDDVALVDAIVRGAVPRLREHIGDEADDELASVVASLLAKDPEARPTNAAVVARALRQWLEARSVDGTAIVADAVRALGLPSLATAT